MFRFAFAMFSAAVVAVVLVWSLVAIMGGGHIALVDEHCKGREFSCGIAAGIVTTLLPILVAFAAFIVSRYLKVWREYRNYARSFPHKMLQAPTPLGPIVGRDDLCELVQDEFERREEEFEEESEPNGLAPESDVTQVRPWLDLPQWLRRFRWWNKPRAHRKRRPVVLVGGIGAGKTAVLIRLTQLLASHGALPIPIRLRDAQQTLDFEELAREKFLKEARRISSAEAEPVWRYLRKNDQIVVIADGLEEALTEFVESRETAIKLAIDDARDSDLPLIVASRPHSALNYLDVRLLRLEPLASADALRYIRGDDGEDSEKRIQKIVERAEVTEMPLFMQIARQLHRKGLLDEVNTRHVGRLGLRVRLLRKWTEELEKGTIEPSVALKSDRRRDAIEKLASLACVGLLNDDLAVSFKDLTPEATTLSGTHAVSGNHSDPEAREFRQEVARIVAADPAKLRAVAADGARLGLVDPLSDGVRFRHSTVQAYLGSRQIGEFFTGAGSKKLRAALADPGRELLMALEMRCAVDQSARTAVVALLRDAVCGTVTAAGSTSEGDAVAPEAVPAAVGADDARAAARPEGPAGPHGARPTQSADASQTAAGAPAALAGWKAVIAASSAVSVHSVTGGVAARKPPGPDPPKDAEARREAEELLDDLIHTAWGEARDSTTAIDEAKLAAVVRIEEAQRHVALWEICNAEQTYRVRLYAARHLGSGGLAAFEAIRERLSAIAEFLPGPPERKTARQLLEAKKVLLPIADEKRRGERDEKQPDRAYALQGLLLPQLLQSVAAERPPADWSHLEGDATHLDRDAMRTEPVSPEVAAEVRKGAAQVRVAAAKAWLEQWEQSRKEAKNELRDLLGQWVKAAGGGRLYRTSEIGLVQGFKHAANRRPVHIEELDTRAYLARQAEILLEGDGTFWFTRIALIQALTLWLLAEPRSTVQPAEARSKIRRWVGDSTHPFVEEAAELCALAIEQRKPTKYIWIEEVEVVSKLGPSAVVVDRTPDRELDSQRWIPRSAGWLTLDERAQQLVAGVVMLLNLADRGGTSQEREESLDLMANHELPPCLTRPRGREHLRVARLLDDPIAGPPGTTCHPDCDMHLCPYPAPGESLSRDELGEAFCRQQQKLLRRRHPLHPRWQLGVGADELARFWADMERRGRR